MKHLSQIVGFSVSAISQEYCLIGSVGVSTPMDMEYRKPKWYEDTMRIGSRKYRYPIRKCRGDRSDKSDRWNGVSKRGYSHSHNIKRARHPHSQVMTLALSGEDVSSPMEMGYRKPIEVPRCYGGATGIGSRGRWRNE